MDKQAQETITINVPKPISKAKDILSRFGEGFGEQHKLLGVRGKLLDTTDSIGDALSKRVRESVPRGATLKETLSRTGGSDSPERAGMYARHYGPHILGLLAALAGGYGLKSMLSKEGSDQTMDKQAQADFERGFMDKLAEYGLDKEV